MFLPYELRSPSTLGSSPQARCENEWDGGYVLRTDTSYGVWETRLTACLPVASVRIHSTPYPSIPSPHDGWVNMGEHGRIRTVWDVR